MSPAPIAYKKEHKKTPVTFQWQTETGQGGQVRRTGTGHCPACRCPLAVLVKETQVVPKGGIFDRRRKEYPTRPVSVLCDCTTLHAGRPAGVVTGCGARITIVRWSV
ncbi:hypothetical protein ACFZBP_28380 [Streptomyces sp. NPDC008086]|uniref:hypothetical protein n=1 Tax=Streptomyces sp. NPDC008086 TaxID=3364807 RepID=UPI0036E555A3